MANRVKRKIAIEQKPAAESKRDRFLRIAEPRMNRALNSIRLLGNLATGNYEWTEDDISRIQQAVVDQLGITLSRFEKKKKRVVEFRFANEAQEEWERASH
jgi:ACT domain-containing protein